ncbi:MAG: CNNM domain-containing protein, partial [Muribaculaceae bacterium]|nr:CNNM domain-containing protein [Muribaculaceae bacterium]
MDPLPAQLLLADLQSSFSLTQIIVLVIALLCLFLSGFVSGSEIAFFSLTPAQCEDIEDTPRGPAVLRLLRRPQRLLATILIANNLVNVTIVVLCNFALGPIFSSMPELLSFILQTVILTFLILLFGEILPKLYANNYPTTWARFAAPGLTFIWHVVGPLANVLVKSGSFVNKVVTKRTRDISTTELSRALEITQGTSGDDKEMLEGILKFGDTTASEIMTPRVDITWLAADMDFNDVMKVVLDTGYSRMPVYAGTQDEIKGILYSRDLLPYIGKELPDGFSWLTLLRQAYYVPESRMIDDLLEDFRRLKLHMA